MGELLVAMSCACLHPCIMQALRADPSFLAYVEQLEQAVERVEGLLL